jgi:hypothetical protein
MIGNSFFDEVGHFGSAFDVFFHSMYGPFILQSIFGVSTATTTAAAVSTTLSSNGGENRKRIGTCLSEHSRQFISAAE